MLVSELIKELQKRLEVWGDAPVAARYEGDFTPYFVLDVSADIDPDTGEAGYIEIIMDDE